jgi:multiple sugar transport system substrate-binding protein
MNPSAHTPPNLPDLTRRGFLGLTGALGAGIALAGCGGKSGPAAGGGSGSGEPFTGRYDGPNVTLAFWNGFTGGDGPYMKKMVDDFNKANANIKVTMTTTQWVDYYQKLPAAVLGGKGPDVGIAHVDQLATMAARQTVLPLDDVASELKLAEDDFVSAVWNAGIYKGKRYGIPLDVHCLAQYWNQAITDRAGLTKAPATKDEFEAALAASKGAGVANPFWMPSLWPSHLMFMSLVWQFGGSPFSEDGTKASFDSDAGISALSWQVEQITKGFSPRNVAADTQYNAFKTNRNAYTWDGIWQINDLKSTSASLKWGISYIPTIGQQQAVWSNGHNFVLMRQRSADDNRLQAAKVFINYISGNSAQWANSGMIPARNSERQSATFTGLTQAAVAKDVNNLRFLPSVPGLGDVITQTIEKAVNKATLLQQSPADALREAAGNANKLLADNRKKFGD